MRSPSTYGQSSTPRPLSEHLSRTKQRGELDELRGGCRLDLLQHVRERHANPRDHHGPGFDAAQAIDPLLERLEVHEVFDRVVAGLADHAVDLDGPWFDLERARVLGGIALLDPELVEIVVRRDVLERIQPCRARRTSGCAWPRAPPGSPGRGEAARPASTGSQSDGAVDRGRHELAAGSIDRLRGDLRTRDVPRCLLLGQHDGLVFILCGPATARNRGPGRWNRECTNPDIILRRTFQLRGASLFSYTHDRIVDIQQPGRRPSREADGPHRPRRRRRPRVRRPAAGSRVRARRVRHDRRRPRRAQGRRRSTAASRTSRTCRPTTSRTSSAGRLRATTRCGGHRRRSTPSTSACRRRCARPRIRICHTSSRPSR